MHCEASPIAGAPPPTLSEDGDGELSTSAALTLVAGGDAVSELTRPTAGDGEVQLSLKALTLPLSKAAAAACTRLSPNPSSSPAAAAGSSRRCPPSFGDMMRAKSA